MTSVLRRQQQQPAYINRELFKTDRDLFLFGKDKLLVMNRGSGCNMTDDAKKYMINFNTIKIGELKSKSHDTRMIVKHVDIEKEEEEIPEDGSIEELSDCGNKEMITRDECGDRKKKKKIKSKDITFSDGESDSEENRVYEMLRESEKEHEDFIVSSSDDDFSDEDDDFESTNDNGDKKKKKKKKHRYSGSSMYHMMNNQEEQEFDHILEENMNGKAGERLHNYLESM